MAYPGVISGLNKFIEKYGYHRILSLYTDHDYVMLCAVLYNNCSVLNYHMAMVCDVSSGEMSAFRRLDPADLNTKENKKLLIQIRPKLRAIVDSVIKKHKY